MPPTGAAATDPRSVCRLPAIPLGGRQPWTRAAVQSAQSALAALAAHKVRSFMTMFGIVLGTCGVLVIDGLGQTQNAALARQLAQLGTNLVSITPGVAVLGGRSAGPGSKPALTNRDVVLLQQQLPYVSALTPLVGGTQTLVAGEHTVGANVVGAYPAAETVQSDAVQLGTFFTEADEADHAAVAVLGRTVVDQLFAGRSPLGATVRIGGTDFRVAGVLRAKGHSGQTDLDDVAIVPFSTAQQRLFGPKLDSILIQAQRTEDIAAVMAAATVTLDLSHHIPAGGRGDFAIQNYQRVVDVARQQAAILTRILTAVAGVALVIGGFGLMNIMLISVTERTAEIGLRLAVGARPSDVLLQFLVEALTLTVAAGLAGLLLGFALPVVLRLPVRFLAQYPNLPRPGTAVFALVTAVAIGVVFGLFPALRASRMNPVTALRYE